MFTRSERFADKVEVTPGPNHYDVKNANDDSHKRFGFLNKTKRFSDAAKSKSTSSLVSVSASGAADSDLNEVLLSTKLSELPPPPKSIYEHNSLSASLPSLVIGRDRSQCTSETASIHSNGSTTPEHGANARRPAGIRSKSTDKIGQAFIANSNKAEERLRRELTDLSERFEKLRQLHQRDLDAANEKYKKGELLYQSVVKEKSSILTQLTTKESEIADLNAKHNVLKSTLEKSERAATASSEKLAKTAQLQKRIDEMERIQSRHKQALEDQEVVTKELRQKLDHERQQLQQQLSDQKASLDAEAVRVKDAHQSAIEKLRFDLKKAQNDVEYWKRRVEALERRIRELEEELAAERRKVEELRKTMRDEIQRLQGLLNAASKRIQDLEKELEGETVASRAAKVQLQGENDRLEARLQEALSELNTLTTRQQAAEKLLEDQRRRHADAVDTMVRQYDDQKAHIQKERQDHLKAKQELEHKVTSLITELAQNRDELLRIQAERTRILDKENQSQIALEELSKEMGRMEDMHRISQEALRQQQESWIAKYETLQSDSLSQKLSSEAALTNLKTALESKSEEHSQALNTIQAVQAELSAIEIQYKEVASINLEQKRQAEEALLAIARLEGERLSQAEKVENMNEANVALTAKIRAKESSVASLESEIEFIRKEKAEDDVSALYRIQELETQLVDKSKSVEALQEEEQRWERERDKFLEDMFSQSSKLDMLEKRLEQTTEAQGIESKVSAGRIKGLEDRCHRMEKVFQDLFKASGASMPSDTSREDRELWQEQAATVLQMLMHNQTMRTEFMKEREELERVSSFAPTALQDQKSVTNSNLQDKIAELEDLIRQLRAQVEFLEAENIGKVAIIKALQDEYEYQERLIRDLSKNEDAAKEVTRLEEEIRVLTNHTREMDGWVKQVQEDVAKYKAAYIKADTTREETLLDMARLHEELAESERARVEVEHQLQLEVSMLIKKHDLTGNELSRLSKMSIDSAQSQGLKQKVKQIAQLKEENLTLKKKNLSLSNTRDSLRLKYLHVERELEAYKAVTSATTGTSTPYLSGFHLNEARRGVNSCTGLSGASTPLVAGGAGTGGYSGSSTIHSHQPTNGVDGSTSQLLSTSDQLKIVSGKLHDIRVNDYTSQENCRRDCCESTKVNIDDIHNIDANNSINDILYYGNRTIIFFITIYYSIEQLFELEFCGEDFDHEQGRLKCEHNNACKAFAKI
ncbi:hypothetical protein BGW38_000692 [Lunasporangiospora selenospora]|uniref:Uncharacterized protein n=1 Tax=Lunasporangiospora selenospora TaxID=979761 RepID=A0A9P6KJ97_9FUNG|nr:hypothetical protein BGW38_000692 [Lunasporangiospora selenospora]